MIHFIKASEMEVVEDRLFYEIQEDRSFEAAIEFMCLRGVTAESNTMELHSSDHPGVVNTGELLLYNSAL